MAIDPVLGPERNQPPASAVEFVPRVVRPTEAEMLRGPGAPDGTKTHRRSIARRALKAAATTKDANR